MATSVFLIVRGKITEMRKALKLTFCSLGVPASHLSLCLLIAVIVVTGCTNASSNDEARRTTSPEQTTSASIEGNWELIWGNYNGRVQNPGKSFQFKTFYNNFFSLIAWDSTGKFSYAGYGKYEIQGNTYKETFLYHSHTPFIGASNWQQYELKEDTLYFKGFNKVIVGGKDVTGNFSRMEEKRVHAK